MHTLPMFGTFSGGNDGLAKLLHTSNAGINVINRDIRAPEGWRCRRRSIANTRTDDKPPTRICEPLDTVWQQDF